jgi:hypothetical protein
MITKNSSFALQGRPPPCFIGDRHLEPFQPGRKPGQVSQLEAVALSDREVFVCDSGNIRIQVFDLKGRFVRMWGERGRGHGQFHKPIAIAVLRNRVFVADVDCLQAFGLHGEFVWRVYHDFTPWLGLNIVGDMILCWSRCLDNNTCTLVQYSLDGECLHRFATSELRLGQILISARGEILAMSLKLGWVALAPDLSSKGTPVNLHQALLDPARK